MRTNACIRVAAWFDSQLDTDAREPTVDGRVMKPDLPPNEESDDPDVDPVDGRKYEAVTRPGGSFGTETGRLRARVSARCSSSEIIRAGKRPGSSLVGVREVVAPAVRARAEAAISDFRAPLFERGLVFFLLFLLYLLVFSFRMS